MMTTIALTVVRGELPPGFDGLRQEAASEGHNHIERLARDWADGTLRFDRGPDLLLAAWIDGELAGLGGATIEPALPRTLRLRRFYVRPAYRRAGIGRALAAHLVGHADARGHGLTLNALAREARAFWERLGFMPDQRGLGFSHSKSQPMIKL